MKHRQRPGIRTNPPDKVNLGAILKAGFRLFPVSKFRGFPESSTLSRLVLFLCTHGDSGLGCVSNATSPSFPRARRSRSGAAGLIQQPVKSGLKTGTRTALLCNGPREARFWSGIVSRFAPALSFVEQIITAFPPLNRQKPSGTRVIAGFSTFAPTFFGFRITDVMLNP
jgi:hypothetical protein